MSGRAWQLAFAGSRLLVVEEGSGIRLPEAEELASALETDSGVLGHAEVPLPAALGWPCRAFDLPRTFDPPRGFGLLGLRDVYQRIPDELFRAAGTALQKVDWLRTHGFCSRCGHATRRHRVHEAMECPACGHLHFPRLAPAVIVLVERGREMLLARSPGFPEGLYSTVAGFVEPGESLEEAARREIAEEVGVEVGDLRYFGSQPWPFPHSLMIGFVAPWARGDVRPDGTEVVDAQWFSPERLPLRLPSGLSIARRMVDDFLTRSRECP